MSEAFDKLKAILAQNGELSSDDVTKITHDLGDITDDEKMWLESEKLRLEKENKDTITMDQYLEALGILDTAAADSDEYKKAESLVQKYESGG